MRGITPSFDEFVRLAGRYSHVPLAATLIFDDLNPLNAFARLQADSRRAFLLESVVGGENVARYSFLGSDPSRTLEVRGYRAVIRENRNGHAHERPTGDPLADVAQLLRDYRTVGLPGLPRCLGGAVGYAGYDLARYYAPLPGGPVDDRELPELLFDFYESAVIFDHVTKLVHVVTHAEVPPEAKSNTLRRCYAEAVERVEGLIERLGWPYALDPVRVELPVKPAGGCESNLSAEQFAAVVARCCERVRAGEVAWVAPSVRWSVTTGAEPLAIYRALRVICPSPFMFYLKTPPVTLIGASPQMLCRVQDGVVSTRVLSSARARGATPEEDAQRRAALLADPRERAVHALLVHAARDDLTSVATPGSLQVTDAPKLDFYSQFVYLASAINGEMRPEAAALDALRATLPCAAVAGTPRRQAMQIIDQCEPVRRGPYGGAVGYVDFSGNMDTCIGTQTLVVRPAGHERRHVHVQAGAGVCGDVRPEEQFDQAFEQAVGLLSAIRLAEESFPD